MFNFCIYWLIYLTIYASYTEGFIPQPLIADGAQTDESITHTEITEMGFIRSLARFFYETRIDPNNTGGTTKAQKFYSQQFTIDELYKQAHPEYSDAEVEFYSLPLKFNLDFIMTYNALVDIDPDTKKLSPAHFDSETFDDGNTRVTQMRQIVVNDSTDPDVDLTNARKNLGQLFHTLQDFYSHSNWVEMGNTIINILIGRNANIGKVAASNQATCSDTGCVKITQQCSLWQKITLNNCPLVYYNCSNNILPDINSQQILTSGYLFNQFDKNGQPLNKPANVGKCSHGSVSDDSAHVPAIGGINKDSNSLIFSPHSNLHYQAVEFAVNATEYFLNELRQDIGNDNFDRLFLIHPTDVLAQQISNEVAQGKRFRLFSPYITASVKKSESFITDVKNSVKAAYNKLKSLISNIFSKNKINIPTYDLSDLGMNTNDKTNVHTAPLAMNAKSPGRKKRLIDEIRKRRHVY